MEEIIKGEQGKTVAAMPCQRIVPICQNREQLALVAERILRTATFWKRQPRFTVVVTFFSCFLFPILRNSFLQSHHIDPVLQKVPYVRGFLDKWVIHIHHFHPYSLRFTFYV